MNGLRKRTVGIIEEAMNGLELTETVSPAEKPPEQVS
jgi:hypothetical protein